MKGDFDMLDQILTKLGLSDGPISSEAPPTKRKYIRHPGSQAEVSVADRVYSIRDWSLGGLCFEASGENGLVVGDVVTLDLKFRLPHETVSIRQQAKVVRTAKRGIAAQFQPLPSDIRRLFDRVIDGFNAQSFIESQVA
jgi:hypothetical protein